MILKKHKKQNLDRTTLLIDTECLMNEHPCLLPHVPGASKEALITTALLLISGASVAPILPA